LAADFIQTVQAYFVEKEKLVINLDGGIQFDPDHGVVTKLNTKMTNSFISLLEKRNPGQNVMTVFEFHHTEIPRPIEVSHVDKGYHWLKIIHEGM
jgi:hypothetical protein